MTLVITELTNAGISMVADSAITTFNRKGEIIEVDQKGWNKLLKVPKINAGVSYWGLVGKVRTGRQFDEWLQSVIKDETSYHDIFSFAEYVSYRLSKSCGNKPLAEKEEVGIHIGGYAPWSDGIERPFFFHVHNGHGRYVSSGNLKYNERLGGDEVTRVKWEWISEPRELFSAHQDYPIKEKSLNDNCRYLKSGFVTRNGQFFIYAELWKWLHRAILFIDKMDGVSLPREPDNLHLRTRFLVEMIQTIIRIYKYSNLHRTVGGTAKGLAVSKDRLEYIP